MIVKIFLFGPNIKNWIHKKQTNKQIKQGGTEVVLGVGTGPVLQPVRFGPVLTETHLGSNQTQFGIKTQKVLQNLTDRERENQQSPDENGAAAASEPGLEPEAQISWSSGLNWFPVQTGFC